MSVWVKTFEIERETRRTIRYREAGDEDRHGVGTIYIKKTTLAKLGDPRKLEVTISAAEGGDA